MLIKPMNWTPHITVAAVIEKQNRFLLVEERIGGRAVFNQPAGHLEAGEDLLQAVAREVLEETAHVFEPQTLVGVYLYEIPQKQRSYLRFCFSGIVQDQPLNRPLDKEIIAVHWLSRDEMQNRQQRLRSPMVLRCVEDYLGGVSLPLSCLHYLQEASRHG